MGSHTLWPCVSGVSHPVLCVGVHPCCGTCQGCPPFHRCVIFPMWSHLPAGRSHGLCRATSTCQPLPQALLECPFQDSRQKAGVQLLDLDLASHLSWVAFKARCHLYPQLRQGHAAFGQRSPPPSSPACAPESRGCEFGTIWKHHAKCVTSQKMLLFIWAVFCLTQQRCRREVTFPGRQAQVGGVSALGPHGQVGRGVLGCVQHDQT